MSACELRPGAGCKAAGRMQSQMPSSVRPGRYPSCVLCAFACIYFCVHYADPSLRVLATHTPLHTSPTPPGGFFQRRRYLGGLQLATAVVLCVDAADESRFPVVRDFFAQHVLPEVRGGRQRRGWVREPNSSRAGLHWGRGSVPEPTELGGSKIVWRIHVILKSVVGGKSGKGGRLNWHFGFGNHQVGSHVRWGRNECTSNCTLTHPTHPPHQVCRRHLPLLLLATKRDVCDWGAAEDVALDLDLAILMAHVAAPWTAAHVVGGQLGPLREPLTWLLQQSSIVDHLWHSWPSSAPVLLHYQQVCVCV